MKKAKRRRLMTFAATLAIVALTSLSLFMGWAMDHSILPPYGGGWRCYVACMEAVWTLPIGGVLLACLPSFARWLTGRLVG
jgi:hypothetical protein